MLLAAATAAAQPSLRWHASATKLLVVNGTAPKPSQQAKPQ
jgi:hypothetical protein